MLSWISDHPGWDTQELWWKMCATTHRTQRYESPWLPGIGIKGARYQTFKSKMITCLWPLKDGVSDFVIHRGDIITRNSLQSIFSDVICQSQWKQLAMWCLIVDSEMTSPTKDSALEVNNSTFIIWWIHSSIAANLNAKWWIIFFNLFAFSEARNPRNIRLPSGSITPYILSHTQSVIKAKKGFSMSMPNAGI